MAVQSPTELSPCEYKYVKEGQYEGSFDIHGWFWLPKYNTMYYTTAPVRVDVGSVSNATGEIHAVVKASELTK